MRCLPEIRNGCTTWLLPLSEATARLFVFRQAQGAGRYNTGRQGASSQAASSQAANRHASQQGVDGLTYADIVDHEDIQRCLLCDPAFALWCAAHLNTSDKSLSIEDLAYWFASTDAMSEASSVALSNCHTTVKKCRALAESSLARCRQRYKQPVDWLRKPKALAALLHNARQWFEVAGTTSTFTTNDLPLPIATRNSIVKLAKKEGKSVRRGRSTISPKWSKRIRRTWRRRNSDWSNLLAISRKTLSPNDPLQQEKLAAIRQLAYGASHEINNPLANITTRAQTLMRSIDDDGLKKHLASINQQAFRAHEMIADLMFFAKPPAPEVAALRIDELVGNVIEQLKKTVPLAENVNVHHARNSTTTIADHAQLAMAVKAILQNAFEALRGEGSVWITYDSTATNGSARRTRLAIRDNGPGLSPDAQKHLFDPFFSGREAGRGLGFGLSKAWRIIQLHGGRLSVETPTGGGTQFVIEMSANRSGTEHLDGAQESVEQP